MDRDTSFIGRVRRCYSDNNLLVYGVIGHILSVLVFLDMVEKLSGGSGTSWSPLRLLGPTVWLPLTTVAGRLMAAQALVHSVMYFVACFYLVQSRYRKNVRLLGPWITMHCFFLVYQIVLVMENREDYKGWETFLSLFSCPVFNFALLMSVSHTAIHWKPEPAQRRSEPVVPVETEHDPREGYSREEENPASSGHSAETVLVSDKVLISPPQPHAEPRNRRLINFGWPWRWGQSRAATAAVYPPTPDAPPTPPPDSPDAAEPQAVVDADALQSLATEPPAAAPPSGGSVGRAGPTSWLGSWRWRRRPEAPAPPAAAAVDAPPGGGQQESVTRRRALSVAVAGLEATADEPLLQ